MLFRRLPVLAAATMVLAACGSPAAPALTDPKDILSKSIVAPPGPQDRPHPCRPVGLDQGRHHRQWSKRADRPDRHHRRPGRRSRRQGHRTSARRYRPCSASPWTSSSSGPIRTPRSACSGRSTRRSSTADLASLVPSGAGVLGSGSHTDPQQILNDVKAALDKLATPPVKDPDEKCGDQDCYKVTMAITAADLSSGGDALGAGVTGTGSVDVWVRKNDLVPAKAVVTINAGDQGHAFTDADRLECERHGDHRWRRPPTRSTRRSRARPGSRCAADPTASLALAHRPGSRRRRARLAAPLGCPSPLLSGQIPMCGGSEASFSMPRGAWIRSPSASSSDVASSC